MLTKQYWKGDLNVFPVTLEDKWCYKPKAKNGQPLSEGDWGYILVLPPILPKEKEEEIVLIIIEGIDAYSIVRSKKISSQFLLQIVPTYYDKKYDIFFYRVKDDPLYKGTKAYVMNIIDRSK